MHGLKTAQLLIVLMLLAGCAERREPIPQSASPTNPNTTASTCTAGQVEEGRASWYGESHKGKKTASGQLFDPDAPTAAHRTLPFGQAIRVTNLGNGRATTLTVNDRGPNVRSRVLDVSKKGAEALGFAGDGTALVRVEPLRSGCGP